MSIIWFADDIISKLSVPKLSTINQHAEEIGKSAVQLLVKRLENKGDPIEPETKVVKTSLVIRESSWLLFRFCGFI
jgi:LacI family transcriptional regulator